MLKTKPTDRGVAFYSKDGLDLGGGNILSEGNFDVSGANPEKGMGTNRLSTSLTSGFAASMVLQKSKFRLFSLRQTPRL